MEIINKKISEIIPYEKNPRNNKEAVKYVANSIKEFGFKIPIVIDKDGVIVCGHTRLLAAKSLKLKEVPTIIADDLTEEQIKAFRLADNKVSEKATWDLNLLQEELNGILNIDMTDFNFSNEEEEEEKELTELGKKYDETIAGSLSEKYIVPPFSILDARQGKWQKRKKQWLKFIDSGKGRSDTVLGKGMKELGQNSNANLTGTSIFDPVLAEILLTWFSPKKAKVIDPFAGGSVRGMVTAALGREYYGNDLSKEQIEENKKQSSILKGRKTVFGDAVKVPNYTQGDSKEIDTIIKEKDFDFLLTCPPYADLEVYSDDPKDISNMEYEDFLKVYREILKKSVDKLKENAFCAVVVGEVRDKNGIYRNFIGDTIKAMEDAGCKYYNEIILITMNGTLSLRAGKVFEASRKVGNTHQKALVFLKSNGDEKALKKYLDSFDNERQLTEMKQNILIFLKGNSKLAKSDIETFNFDLF